jgi:hypothetical protein
MYKGISRFRQALARKGRKLTSRNLVMSDASPQSGRPLRKELNRRLDEEVKNATQAPQTGNQPQLVKRPRPRDSSN